MIGSSATENVLGEKSCQNLKSKRPKFEIKSGQNLKSKGAQIWNQSDPNLKSKVDQIWNQKLPKFEIKCGQNLISKLLNLISKLPKFERKVAIVSFYAEKSIHSQCFQGLNWFKWSIWSILRPKASGQTTQNIAQTAKKSPKSGLTDLLRNRIERKTVRSVLATQ